MTVDIGFGILVEEIEEMDGEMYRYNSCQFPGVQKEDDGTNQEYTIYAGFPTRSMATLGFYDWMRSNPDVAALIKKLGKPGTNDFHYHLLTDEVVELVSKLRRGRSDLDRDRIKWLKYWAKRAKEQFGDEAIVAFW